MSRAAGGDVTTLRDVARGLLPVRWRAALKSALGLRSRRSRPRRPPAADIRAAGAPAALTYRAYAPGDGPAINAGFNEAFGLRRPSDEWAWKYGTEATRARIAVALDGSGAIVAHYGFALVMLQIDGRRVQAGQVCDSFTLDRPGVRGGPAFARTAQLAFDRFCGPEGAALLYGFPNRRVLRFGRQRLRYGEPVEIVTWRYAVPRRWRLRVPRPCPSDPVVPAAADALWQRAGSRHPVAAVRDAAWLVRRFFSRPDHRYVFLAVGDDPLTAWAVAAVRRRQVTWVDLLWDGADEADLRLLHDRVLDLARVAGATELTMWLSNDPPVAALLAGHGWRAAPHAELLLTARSWDPGLDADRAARRLTLTLADSDLA